MRASNCRASADGNGNEPRASGCYNELLAEKSEGTCLGADRFRLCTPRRGKRVGAGQRPPYKRRGNQLSADKNQRDYALAA